MALDDEITKAIGAHGVWKMRLRSAIDSGKADADPVEVGKDNRFGLPRDKALVLLQEQGARIWRTDLDGAVCFESDGKGYRIR